VNECYNQINYHTLTIQCQVPSLDATATPAYRHITFNAFTAVCLALFIEYVKSYILIYIILYNQTFLVTPPPFPLSLHFIQFIKSLATT